MEYQQSNLSGGTVHVESIGGIEAASVELTPGVTILVGRNATNRTSFLQAVMAVLGSDDVSIKGDADEAQVELDLAEKTYTRQFHRRDGTVVSDGEPYLEDSTLADLFAFLLESNEVRRAVAASDDLRALIMRPVDTEAIQNEIDRLVEERESIQRELDETDELKRRLPELEEQRTQLRNEIDETKTQLEAKEKEISAADADVEETREGKSALEDELEELRSRRSDLDDVRYDLRTERESIEALEREQRELEEKLSKLPGTPAGELEEIESGISRLRQRKQGIENGIDDLQSVIAFNEEMLDDGGPAALDEDRVDSAGTPMDELLPDEQVTCWTCGSEVERDQIESTLDHLRQRNQAKLSDVADIDDELDELNTRKQELEESQRERDRTERRLSQVETEVEESNAAIQELRAKRDQLTDEIETIETEVEELEKETHNTVIELHKEANQLEYELGRLETDLGRVEDEIDDLEHRIDHRDGAEAQLEEVKTKITDLRTRIDRIEQAAVEEFNDHMETVLGRLDYDNLDRIWIERVRREVREGRQKVSKTVFELHVIRKSSSGVAYEDTVDHLSESEREVTGIVFALAGYLCHEVYEELPFMLLDSLEAIDAGRIATLVEYLTDYTGYLLVTLLPEDAAALPDEYERITEI